MRSSPTTVSAVRALRILWRFGTAKSRRLPGCYCSRYSSLGLRPSDFGFFQRPASFGMDAATNEPRSLGNQKGLCPALFVMTTRTLNRNHIERGTELPRPPTGLNWKSNAAAQVPQFQQCSEEQSHTARVGRFSNPKAEIRRPKIELRPFLCRPIYFVAEFPEALQFVDQGAAADAQGLRGLGAVKIMFTQCLKDGLPLDFT